MNFVTLNIQYGVGRDGTVDLARTAAAIADADIVALQEVDRYWRRTGLKDQPAELAGHLPEHHWVYGANLDMHAATADGRPTNRRKQFGTMILARWPILSSRNFPLPKAGLLDHHSIQQGVLEAVVAGPSGALRVYSTHLSHLTPDTRLPQVEALRDIVRRAPEEGGAWCGDHPNPESGWFEEDEPPMPETAIVAGDLNVRPGAPEYDLLVGPPAGKHGGRLRRRDGLHDAWTAAGNDEASGITCWPKQPVGEVTERRIDHVLVTSDLLPHVRRAWIDDDCDASDHQPVWVEFEL